MFAAAKANSNRSFPSVVRRIADMGITTSIWLRVTKRETRQTCLPKTMVTHVNVDKDGTIVLMRTRLQLANWKTPFTLGLKALQRRAHAGIIVKFDLPAT